MASARLVNDDLVAALRSCIRTWARSQNYKFESELISNYSKGIREGFRFVLTCRQSLDDLLDEAIWFSVLLREDAPVALVRIQSYQNRFILRPDAPDFYHTVDLAEPNSLEKLELHLTWAMCILWDQPDRLRRKRYNLPKGKITKEDLLRVLGEW